MIETEDYRFTNRAWAQYTGRQIHVVTIALLGLFLTYAGFSASMAALSQLIVSTPDGVLIARDAQVGWAPLWGSFVGVFGLQLVTITVRFWPTPGQFALPDEVEGYFACGGGSE